MDDLIKRQDAIDACLNGFCACVNDCVDEIEKLPSAEPVIIRCKYCKHFNDGDCEELPKLVSEDDFCSFAERRTDE